MANIDSIPNILNESQIVKFILCKDELFDSSVEFIQNYVYESEQKKIILQNTDDLYVLITPFKQKHLILQTLRKILNKDDYNNLQRNGYFIIGLLLLDHSIKNNRYQYIDYIDSRIKGYNIAYYMIEKYEKEYDKVLLPYDILKSSAKYWKKYFEKKFNVKTSMDLDNIIIKGFNIKNNIHWEYLIELYMNNK